MLPVLGLISGWLLLMPLLLLGYVFFGGRPVDWLMPILQIGASVPMLGFCSIAGLFLVITSIMKLASSNRRDLGPY